MKLVKTTISSACFLFASFTTHAATIHQPVSATSSVGSFNTYGPQYTIDQSGLSASYTSGVTDFTTFATTTTSVSGGSSFNGWFAPSNTTTGNIDFDLGGLVNIEAFALWNDYQAASQGIDGFRLWADDNAAFSSATLLGTFNAVITAEPNNFGQIFNFSQTSASHVRLEILSNHGSTFTVGFNEAAFGVSAVPVPAAVWLFGSGLIGLIGLARRTV